MGAFASGLLNGGVGLVGGLLNGIFNRKAQTELGAGQVSAANNANQTAWDQYILNRSDLTPYVNTGQDAISTLGYLLGIGAKPGSTPVAAAVDPKLQQQLDEKSSTLQFYKDWLAGKHPINAQGKDQGGAPKNAATVAKIQGLIGQLERDVTSIQTQINNNARQSTLTSGMNPEDFGSLTKDFTAADFDINKDPGAQYRMDQAQKAIERSAAARGGVQSGGTLKALQTNSQNLASQEFENAYNRFNSNRQFKVNTLLGTAGMGSGALNTQVNSGQRTGENIANSTANGIIGSSQANAAGTINQGNIINDTIGGLMDLYNLWDQNKKKTAVNPGSAVYSTPPFVPITATTPKNRFGTSIFGS